MSMKRAFLCVIVCNLVRLGWTAEREATADMPTVMEAIVRAMIDFRKEILDNLQLSLEYHTEQLEEIKQHMEYKLIELRDEINRKLNHQQNSSSLQTRELLAYHKEEIKVHVEHTVQDQEKWMKTESESRFKELREFNKMLQEETKTLFDKCKAQIQEFGKTLNAINIRTLYGVGWTVFQRRIDGSVDFYRNWTTYKHGFGDVNGEHWLGLEQLHIMTSSGRHELLVLVEDFEGNSAYAFYDEFEIASEVENYKLTVGKYSGTAGDSLEYYNGRKFTTFDQDNDNNSGNLARRYKGAWWFGSAWKSHLNGPYFIQGDHKQWGVSWATFQHSYSLKSATMMFRSRASN